MEKPNTPVVKTDRSLSKYYSQLAFFYAVPIEVLGGLIGLGGAEFRLPVFVGVFDWSDHWEDAGWHRSSNSIKVWSWNNLKYFGVSSVSQIELKHCLS
ncbi:hypothetical protein JOY44_10030 [Phormidium sp. CLA17]|uniref:hypothetical protein n=1 Tax=Leptolyngbya sp. Cla-17 TaxID=2803751 RepID=UPI0018D63A2F|nr:hypothetical protein [Leptolyngbya sp. Cla-17]MBM0741959.1 hypothetical protein [Leptolyngbya sp. Cla-17]